MIKFEHVEVVGWEHALRGMRNPKNSWDRSDTTKDLYCREGQFIYNTPVFKIGPNDHKLAIQLSQNGPVHAKYRRMITVYLDITAPLYWWKEFDTYKIGTTSNSCSTMHTIQNKEFTLDDFSCEHLTCFGAATRHNDGKDIYDESVGEFAFDYVGSLLGTIIALNAAREQYLKRKEKMFWWQMIQLLPSSYNQRRTIMLNYEVLANIYKHRQNHKLDEWIEFCKMIEALPYSGIITQKENNS